MATRQKKTVISGVTRDAAEDALAAYAKADASINKINAEIELQCAKIREKWQDRLTALTVERGEAFDVLQSFGIEHQHDLFSKRKSIEMVHGLIGFRTGTPKLKTLKNFTWASALELAKRVLPAYVRTKDELAKDRLLADRDVEEVRVEIGEGEIVPMAEAMRGCGLVVVQDETFFVEPKSEGN